MAIQAPSSKLVNERSDATAMAASRLDGLHVRWFRGSLVVVGASWSTRSSPRRWRVRASCHAWCCPFSRLSVPAGHHVNAFHRLDREPVKAVSPEGVGAKRKAFTGSRGGRHPPPWWAGGVGSCLFRFGGAWGGAAPAHYFLGEAPGAPGPPAVSSPA